MGFLHHLLVSDVVAFLGGIATCGLLGGIFLLLARRKALGKALHYAALEQSNRRNERIVEASGEGILELDVEGYIRFANPAAAHMLGYGVEELSGRDYRELITAQHESSNHIDSGRYLRHTTDVRRGVGAVLKRKDGRSRPVEYKVVPIFEHGQTTGTVLAFADISERVRLDAILRDSQFTTKVGGCEYDFEANRSSWTDEAYRIHDLQVGQRVELEQALDYYHPQDQPRVRAAMKTLLEKGGNFDLEARLITAKRRELWVRFIAKAERRNGKVVRLSATIQDVSDQKQVQQQLRETHDFYELTLNAMPIKVAYADRQEIITYCNKAAADWLGRPREQIVGRSYSDFVGDEYDKSKPHVNAAMRGQRRSFALSGSYQGQSYDWRVHLVPQLTSAGEIIGFFSIAHDLTDFKRLEARLLHAQKMQAVGQLTGGIAHDFNNLLGIVLGNLQLLERGVGADPQMSRKVRTAMRAAMRGADLTRRLLTFARRQILDPIVADLNRLLGGFGELLQRTLGESIQIHTVFAADLWRTRVDPGQLENAILNLAINARDAMPQGGRLTLETRNTRLDAAFCFDHPHVEPGEFVSVSVTDTGTGIEGEVLKRVFEPFFTTKESGKGSGLGLSMVHGFAEQSGGIATIESEMGRGTTVRILLPRCEAEEVVAHEDTITAKHMPGGDETLLVVEDDTDLRETAVAALKTLGYRILEAPNADVALRILAGAEHIDLLFTDIMMPGTPGPALAQRARQLRPDLAVLYTTGYAESSVLATGSGVLASEIIPKPYRNEELALRIRYLLDRETAIA
jgi:PAS domain S-box-containing protein